MKNLIFVPMIGQYENIGDIVLRRPLINWLRSEGSLHLFLGNAPDGYAEGLGVQPNDVVYKSFGAWYIAALQAAATGHAHYAFKPGEIQLSLAGLKEHLSVLPLLVLIRLRGGKVVRVGSGARNFAAWPRALMKPSVLLSQLVIWRDAKTASYIGTGEVMPDLAFSEGDLAIDPQDFKHRKLLVISMRGDRESSGREWIEAVRAYAAREGLSICVVTQVMRDADLSRKLATTLNGELVDWDGHGHDLQEAKLRDLYRKARVVVSDRLHVLIAAYTHGAVPVGMNGYSSDKIDRHFDVIGVKGVTIFTNGMTTPQITDEIDQRLQKGAETVSRLEPARHRLADVRQTLGRLMLGKGYANA